MSECCRVCGGWGEVMMAGIVAACPTCYPDAYEVDLDLAPGEAGTEAQDGAE